MNRRWLMMVIGSLTAAVASIDAGAQVGALVRRGVADLRGRRQQDVRGCVVPDAANRDHPIGTGSEPAIGGRLDRSLRDAMNSILEGRR